MDDNTYKKMHPTSTSSPKFYPLPKIHKRGTPFRLTVSSRGSVTSGVGKELVAILKSLVIKYICHVNNTEEFVECMRNIRLGAPKCITSYDVAAHFISLSVEPAIHIIDKTRIAHIISTKNHNISTSHQTTTGILS